MHLIPLTSVVVEDRQRKTLRNIPDLAESIRRNGLIHAPVVEPIGCDDEGCPHFNEPHSHPDVPQRFRLIAGERRLRAVEQIQQDNHEGEVYYAFIYAGESIPYTFLPVTFRSELSDVQRKEIELEENLLRENLTWQEEALALADLHALRTAQRQGQPIAVTAQEVSEKTGEVAGSVAVKISRAITVAKQLSDPKIAGARNLKEAANIITRSFEEQIKQDLIKAVGDTTDHAFHEGSCIAILPTLQSGSFDCILTDPPYGMGADTFGDVAGGHGYKDDWETAYNIYESILQEGFRLCRPNAHLYMFCDPDRFQWIRDRANEIGWQAFRTPIIWNKTSSMGHDPWPQKGFRRSYETILYAMKGDRPYLSFMEDVIDCPNISSPFHKAAKPPELFRKLLSRSCHPGDKVLDPCCGIGTIFEAASACRVSATGIELDPNYATTASNRRFGRS